MKTATLKFVARRAISAVPCVECQLVDDSLVRQLYNAPTIVERHRHRYEVNNMLLKQIEDAGLRVAGRSGDDQLVEIMKFRITRGSWLASPSGVYFYST